MSIYFDNVFFQKPLLQYIKNIRLMLQDEVIYIFIYRIII